MLELHVDGMSCGHCVNAVTRAVHQVAPDAKVEVDLANGAVRVTAPGEVDATSVSAAIADAGYDVRA